MAEHSYLLEVKANIPEQLSYLPLFSKDLIYSWQQPIRHLFISLDHQLWEDCGHNPSIFLRRIEQQQLDKAVNDPSYMLTYQQTVQWYEQYQQQKVNHKLTPLLDPEQDLIAYFCSEFGFHESLPIYSGGLGILAGDHCKAANDVGAPFIAVGLLYHQGYFTQTIDPDGNQIATNINHYFGHLPISLLNDADGNELHTGVQLPGRYVCLRIWQAKVGRVRLLLLDCDIELNNAEDRRITRQLYGDGIDTRIKQEIVLGVGGVQALRAVGLNPNIWHINEGHAAFQILQRCLEWVTEGVDFSVALELVAGNTIFTTHTPVAAGHDSFSHETMKAYFGEMAQQLNIELDTMLVLGKANNDDMRFNMTAFALRGSRFHNGVSEVHGGIASTMERYIWPEVPPDENPISFITNGVHVASILAKKWTEVFDQYCQQWRDNLFDSDFWQCIDSIPDAVYWQAHQFLKTHLLKDVCKRLYLQHTRNACSRAFQKASICHMQDAANDILILGFARRFATYKRATLLFSDIDRLARIVNDQQRPVVILFAGKAHPSDEPGQQLIREIHQFSERPEFVGKIILLEGYDLSLARYMIAGTDVWLNTPIYPLEACGTSGQKAAINGVVNLSIMDGWWAEGYNGKNGWGIEPHTDKYGADYRNQQEASDLLDIIENEVIPAYFDRDQDNIPHRWIKKSKESMKSCIPQFGAHRMLKDYIEKFYSPAKHHYQRLAANQQFGAIALSQWKKNVRACWPGVNARIIGKSSMGIRFGEIWSIKLSVNLNGLLASDVIAECLMGYKKSTGEFCSEKIIPLTADATSEENNQEIVYRLELMPESSGIYQYKLRMYPYHQFLSHRFEMGSMLWI